jgi:nucleoside-diphosphate-sugar epimerase
MIQGIKKGYYFNIAGGQARKSMVRAEDVARFILPASEVGGIYHLTDGQHPNFFELSHKIGKAFGRNRIPNMPLGIAKVIAKIGDVLGPWFPLNSDKLSKITSELTFDDSLARQNFGWDPKPVLAD